ncbi:MAG TPA: hypothetical protein VNQ76_15825 [Planctomicrobium sp.]|nr:hypothetical protein [Planctomicrobium sp.]
MIVNAENNDATATGSANAEMENVVGTNKRLIRMDLGPCSQVFETGIGSDEAYQNAPKIRLQIPNPGILLARLPGI